MPSARNIPNQVAPHLLAFNHDNIPRDPLVDDVTYYVDVANGDDTNDGLLPETAFATIAHVLGLLPPIIEARVDVYLAAGTYAESPVVRYTTYTGHGSVNLIGTSFSNGATGSVSTIQGGSFGRHVTCNRVITFAEKGARCVFTDGDALGEEFFLMDTWNNTDAAVSYDMDSTTSRAFRTLLPVVIIQGDPLSPMLNTLTVDIDGVANPSFYGVQALNCQIDDGVEIRGGTTSLTNVLMTSYGVSARPFSKPTILNLANVYCEAETFYDVGLFGIDPVPLSNTLTLYDCGIAADYIEARNTLIITNGGDFLDTEISLMGGCDVVSGGAYYSGIIVCQGGDSNYVWLSSGTIMTGYGAASIFVDASSQYNNIFIEGSTSFVQPTSSACQMDSDNNSASFTEVNFIVDGVTTYFTMYSNGTGFRNTMKFDNCAFLSSDGEFVPFTPAPVAYSGTQPDVDVSAGGTLSYVGPDTLNILVLDQPGPLA